MQMQERRRLEDDRGTANGRADDQRTRKLARSKNAVKFGTRHAQACRADYNRPFAEGDELWPLSHPPFRQQIPMARLNRAGPACVVASGRRRAMRSNGWSLPKRSQPSAWEGLAIAALCLDDAVRSRSANERAYREYLERGDFCGAARVAIRLAVYHDAYRGESAIANGWFERARSLLDTVPAAAEHAWLAFWKAHLDIHVHGEVAKGEPSLEDAIRLAAAGNIGGDLELMTRGLRGLLAISEGSVDEGLRRLDEATTEVLAGALPDPQMVGWTYCYVLDACENVRDFDRASQWIGHAVGRRALVPHRSSVRRLPQPLRGDSDVAR